METWSSENNDWILIKSKVALVTPLYSTYVLDLDIVGCFLNDQRTVLALSKTQCPKVELGSSRKDAQSTTTKAVRWRLEHFWNNMPQFLAPC